MVAWTCLNSTLSYPLGSVFLTVQGICRTTRSVPGLYVFQRWWLFVAELRCGAKPIVVMWFLIGESPVLPFEVEEICIGDLEVIGRFAEPSSWWIHMPLFFCSTRVFPGMIFFLFPYFWSKGWDGSGAPKLLIMFLLWVLWREQPKV